MKPPSIKTTLLLLGFCLAFGGCRRRGPVFTPSDPNARSCLHSDEYFPKGSLHWGADQITWDTQYLQMMGESSLYRCPVTGSEPTMRFLWDRSLSQPISVRLSIHPDGTGEAVIRMLAHPGIEPPPSPGEKQIEPQIWFQRIVDQRKTVSKEQVDEVLTLLDRVEFQTSRSDAETTDGSDWIFETEEGGRYRVLDFRNHSSDAGWILGLYMVREIGGMSISDREIY